MAVKTYFTYLRRMVEARPTSVAAVDQGLDGFRSWTWEELFRESEQIAMGLLTLDVKPGERIALLSCSRIEWVLADLAIMACGATSASVLHRLSPDSWQGQIARVGCERVFVDSLQRAEQLARSGGAGRLRQIIIFDQIESIVSYPAVEILSLLELRRRGLAAQGARRAQLQRCQQELHERDRATLVYTAGTTEQIKIVALSHDAMSYEVEALARLDLADPRDVLLLCMPLAHAFARVLVGLWLRTGCCIAFADSTDQLFQRIQTVKPTVTAAPPRVFELLYGTIVRSGQEARGARSHVFAWAMNLARERMHRELEGVDPRQPSWPLARRMVFDRLSDRLDKLFGGRSRHFICGGGPLPDRIAYFYAYAGIDIITTYGLTEAAGISCVNTAGRDKLGSVGPALPGTEIRISDEGEVLLRGRGLMLEYYNEPDTALHLREDGFLATGDLGELDVDGYLWVKGRLADVLELDLGFVVAPQQLEMALRTNAFVGHALVDGRRPGHLVALISLDPETLETWARACKLPYPSFSDLARSPEVRRLVQGIIDDRNRRFAAHEHIDRFAIVEKPFSIGNELTATMRLRRDHVRSLYRPLLDRLTRDHDDDAEEG